MTTYIVTQGIQGPEGPQGATGPAGSGGGGSNEVYFAFQLVREDNLAGVGFTYDPGVSLTAPEESDGAPSGARFVIIKDDETYESYIGDGSKVLLYENPQLSTFGKSQYDLGGQSVLLNVAYDVSDVSVSPENMRTIFNTLYLMNDTELQPIRSDADEVLFDNTTSGFNAINVQAAIDELAGNPDVITIYMIVNEADVVDVLGSTFTPGVSISPVMGPPGLRFLVVERVEEQERTVYRSYTSNGDGLAIYDTDQIMDSASVFTTDSEAEVAFTQGPLLFVMSSSLPGQTDVPSVFKPFKVENNEYLQLIGPSIGDFAGNVIYDNGMGSGLAAGNVQAAIDELAGNDVPMLTTIYDSGDDIDLDGAGPTDAVVLIYGRSDGSEDGVYDVSVAGFVKRPIQPTNVLSAGPVLDSSFANLHTIDDRAILAYNALDVIWTVLGWYSGTGPLSASTVAYTPADSANWTGADPTTIAEAIDRIAAALGPIA